MSQTNPDKTTLSLIIPCYNEERTLRECVTRALEIADISLDIEMIIVDDCSTDRSLQIAHDLQDEFPGIIVLRHEKNLGKGAALRTGFGRATGDFVAVQDADLEYDPRDLKKLLEPLQKGQADVVLGSRFLSAGAHSVLYFWHYLGNRMLTLFSNMFTDLRLTDVETCYKVFRRDVIQKIKIKEDRFGFEPEIVAKIAHRKLRVFEMAISYNARTYEEGKKIGVKDALRAIYCIMRYNVRKAPWPVQFGAYFVIGCTAVLVNLAVFLVLHSTGVGINLAIICAFLLTAPMHYSLYILNLFRQPVSRQSVTEGAVFLLAASLVGSVDFAATKSMLSIELPAEFAKFTSSLLAMVLSFKGRRYLIFPDWDANMRKYSKVRYAGQNSTLHRAVENQASEAVDR